MHVTMYTQPGCHPCRATERKLDRLGIPYQVRDVSVDTEAGDYARSLGFMGTPVVTVADSDGQVKAAWNGYRPEYLQALVNPDVNLELLDMREEVTQPVPAPTDVDADMDTAMANAGEVTE